MNLSQKEKLELRKKIPQQIKDYLASTQKVDIIFELGEKNQLSTQEISIVSDKVTFVLYGLISSTDLEQNLTSSLKIDKNKIKVLTEEIQEKILSNLEKYIQKNEVPVDINTLRKQHKDIETELKTHLSKLPQTVQEFISTGNLKDTLDQVGLEFDLRPSKVIDLKNEILFVLVGLEERSNFLTNLQDNLGLPKELVGKIAEHIETNIFSKFDTELKELENLQNEAEKGVSQPTEDTVPQNLPVQTEGQEIPVFSNEKTISNEKFQMAKNSEVSNNPEKISEESSQVGKSQIPTKPNQASFKQNINKPAYKHPQEVESARGLSQEDIVTNRQKPKPYVPPTRDFGYRDEKIGGVNIERSSQENTEDEHLDRAEVLNDIENPVKTKPSGETAEHSAYKGEDPYRETTK